MVSVVVAEVYAVPTAPHAPFAPSCYGADSVM